MPLLACLSLALTLNAFHEPTVLSADVKTTVGTRRVQLIAIDPRHALVPKFDLMGLVEPPVVVGTTVKCIAVSADAQHTLAQVQTDADLPVGPGSVFVNDGPIRAGELVSLIAESEPNKTTAGFIHSTQNTAFQEWTLLVVTDTVRRGGLAAVFSAHQGLIGAVILPTQGDPRPEAAEERAVLRYRSNEPPAPPVEITAWSNAATGTLDAAVLQALVTPPVTPETVTTAVEAALKAGPAGTKPTMSTPVRHHLLNTCLNPGVAARLHAILTRLDSAESDPEIQFELASCSVLARDSKTAKQEFKRANPNGPYGSLLYLLSAAMLADGDANDAASVALLMTMRCLDDPRGWGLLFRLGQARALPNDLDRYAEQWARSEVSAQSRLVIAKTYRARRQWDKALSMLHEIPVIAQSNESIAAEAACQVELQRWDEVESLLKKLKESNSPPVARFLIEYRLAAGRHDDARAERVLTEWREGDPTPTPWLFTFAFLTGKHRYAEALQTANAAQDRFPTNQEVRAYRVAANANTNDLPAAERAMAEFDGAAADAPNLRLLRAAIAFKAGHKDQAADALAPFKANLPDAPDKLGLVCMIAQWLDDKDTFDRAMAKLAQTDPEAAARAQAVLAPN